MDQSIGRPQSRGGEHRAPVERSFASSMGLTVVGAVIPGTGLWFAGRRLVGAIVVACSAAVLVTGLVLVWHDYETDAPEALNRTFGVGAIIAATLAQASLLLAIGIAAGPVVRRILQTTLALAGLLAVLTALVLADNLGFDTVAEGVETAGQAEVLERLGCELAQGHLFSESVTAEAIDELLAAATVFGGARVR